MLLEDISYMHLALELAKSTISQTAPNPSVGAVIVRENKIVGLGCHLFAGLPHAETYALNMHPELTCGATLYVTLEPCSHHGKTPPCVDAIIQHKIARVVIAVLDPNPLVNGKGLQKLIEAGISVEVGLLEHEAKLLNSKYFYHIVHKMPYITLKAGMSLDGKLATSTFDSKWITGEESRKDAHSYRATHDAILIGANTVINDNPSLTTHLLSGAKNPIRIILDKDLCTPLNANIVIDKISPTWIIVDPTTSDEAIQPFLQYELVKIIKYDSTNLSALLKYLYTLGITSILVEGGNNVHTQFLEKRILNQLILYMAPKLIGGEDAVPFFSGNGASLISQGLNLEIMDNVKLGADIKIIATV